MRGRNLTSSSALLATSCLLVASGTVAYHAMKYNEKLKATTKEQREHSAARVIQDAWRRQSSSRTSQASREENEPLGGLDSCQKNDSWGACMMDAIPTLFSPSRNRWKLLRDQDEAEPSTLQTNADSGFERAQDSTKQVDETTASSTKHIFFSLDPTSPRDVSFEDDESSVNSHDEHVCLSSPTSNKTITFDHRDSHHFRLAHLIVLLITALAVVALGFAPSTHPDNSSLAFNVPSVKFPNHFNGFGLVQSDQQRNVLVEEPIVKKHRIEWQSLPLHFGAK